MRRSFLMFLLAASGFEAFAEQHMVEYLLPRGAGRGEKVEVTFNGLDLKDPREVVFYKPGIRAVNFSIPEELQRQGTGRGGGVNRRVTVQFEIAADCPIGEHALRLRTTTALSEVVTFWVSPFPTVKELEKKIGENDSIETAQPVALNSTVSGEILPGEAMDRDFYRVEAKRGQRISVEVDSIRLGTLHYEGDSDLTVRILNAAGKQLAKNDDNALHVMDPLLTFMAPEDGPFFIEIKQQLFTPARNAMYRAHIGDFVRPMAVYPAGGQIGETIAVRWIGDAAGDATASVKLPEVGGTFEYFAGEAGHQPPSANPLRVSPYPNVLENGTDAATPVPALPAALNGIISTNGEVDKFTFTAKKGESYRVRVYGRTLGSPIDPKIWIRSVKDGKLVVQADDSTLAELGLVSSRTQWHIKDQLDPATVFKAPADGEYTFGVEDTRGQGGPSFVYRAEVEPAQDVYYSHITYREGYQIPRLTGLIVPQGTQWTIDVQVAAGLGNSYKGELELEAAGLPHGVIMIAPRIQTGMTNVPVQFIASADAEMQSALIELRVKAVDSKVKLETGSRYGVGLVNRRGQLPLHFVFLDKYAMAVTKPAPFRIEMEQPDIALAQSGELSLKVKVIRHEGFDGVIEMQPDWLPQGVSKESVVTVAKDKNEASFRISADAKAKAGEFMIAMNATTTDGDAFSGVGRIRVSSTFVKLKVAEPYLAITLQRAAVERGHKGQIIGVLKHNKPFPGKALVTLKRLPNGVTLAGAAPEITSADQQVVFEVEAAADALAGLYKEITCEVTVKENGQSIRQQSGSGILRVDPARARTAVK